MFDGIEDEPEEVVKYLGRNVSPQYVAKCY